MKLIDLIRRKPIPLPWQEGDNIPWHEPGFSERMLKEHLSQEHDAASRRFETIDQHVQWIHEFVLEKKPSKILDLGCGPGLYSNRLAKYGHQCLGIDYSPASIAYAKTTAKENQADCRFLEKDIREANYGEDFDVAMLIYGELNIFRSQHAQMILERIHAALIPGGKLILEPHTFKAIQSFSERGARWYSSEGGLFHPSPHLVLEEYFWEAKLGVAAIRYFVLEAESGEVELHAQTFQAYTKRDYSKLLSKCGYTNINFYPSLTGKPDPDNSSLMVILAEKPIR